MFTVVRHNLRACLGRRPSVLVESIAHRQALRAEPILNEQREL